MTTTMELSPVKTRQQATWASGDYGAVAAIIHPMAEVLVESAGLAPGSRVLDVATGTGNAAIAAARRNCEVTGLDYVPELLDRGRARITAEGLSVVFVDGDAEALPFPDASFDAVISCVGVMFAPDQPQTAAEVARVCRPGGTIALANWTPEGFLGGMFRTLGRYVPPPPGVRPPVEWGTEPRLRELFGYTISDWETSEETFRFPLSATGFVDLFRNTYGPVLKAFHAVDDAARDRLHADLVELCHAYRSEGPGPRGIDATYLRAIGRRA